MAYKHDYDKTLTRLVSILSKLYNGDSLSVKELADEFNVSTRTIQRDFNERLVAFPIYQDNRLWKMQDGFKIEKSTSIEEQVILDIMEKLVDGVGNQFSTKAKNLLSKIKNHDYNPIYAKINMEDIEDKLEIIHHLEIAIKSKFEITCNYISNNSDISNLTLKPLKIVNFEGYWYLLAIDEKNTESIKKYYLKNISNLKTLSTTFLIDDRIDRILEKVSSIWFDNTKEPFEVKIQISKDITKYIKRKPISPSQIFESINEDGSSIISIKITHEMEIIPIIKYWLPNLKILEPKWIDDMICEDLKSYLNI
ncbi:transcriptional regulator, YafY family [Arcobacter acticola]|jgi:predicted DNA-binding transcriptional regulator YafY|uniref:Transcriptional regulator, YafY family n=1 Tax=Arcobacter acticola TaxID=1849015 RepID=A0A6M8EH11_9BACT|nr:WYL domain-containing protein [Arcobacter acticola]QKE29970.1 transcriptional regulator, YafY family [Arcobacter acticola]